MPPFVLSAFWPAPPQCEHTASDNMREVEICGLTNAGIFVKIGIGTEETMPVRFFPKDRRLIIDGGFCLRII